ncbi:MAG: hypothetical protein L0I76_05260 [Pseudonocardia sp.]|nr:hypothetical protein [Pseudonocardia sp.]
MRTTHPAGALPGSRLRASESNCPGRVATLVQGRRADPAAVWFTRLLGLRHLGQAAGALVAPDVLTPRRGAVIDGLHAVTMLALLADRRYRRAAALNIVVACGFVGLGLARPSGGPA